MKTSNKIAPLLIVMFLGIFSYPQLQASIKKSDTIHLHEDPYKSQKFTGFIIDARPSDLLLYQYQTGMADEIHAQFSPSSNENKSETGPALLKNNHSKKCTQVKTNNPEVVVCDPKCWQNQAPPKK